MQNAFLNISAGGGSLQFKATLYPTGDGGRPYRPTTPIPAGKPSVTWDHDTATATLAAEHGLVTSDVVDLYWASGKRCQMTATVTVNSVALAGGHGDELPANGTAVVLSKQVVLADIGFVGDNLTGYFAGGDQRVTFDFLDGDGDSVGTLEVFVPPYPCHWLPGLGANPFAGVTIASVTVSNGSSLLAATPQLMLFTLT
jgi:hypothetical protein